MSIISHIWTFFILHYFIFYCLPVFAVLLLLFTRNFRIFFLIIFFSAKFTEALFCLSDGFWHPFSFPCIDQHQHHSYCPWYRVKHIDDIDAAEMRHYKLNPQDTKQTQCQKHHYHWRHGLSCSTDSSCKRMHNSKKEIKWTEIFHCLCAEIN